MAADERRGWRGCICLVAGRQTNRLLPREPRSPAIRVMKMRNQHRRIKEHPPARPPFVTEDPHLSQRRSARLSHQQARPDLGRVDADGTEAGRTAHHPDHIHMLASPHGRSMGARSSLAPMVARMLTTPPTTTRSLRSRVTAARHRRALTDRRGPDGDPPRLAGWQVGSHSPALTRQTRRAAALVTNLYVMRTDGSQVRELAAGPGPQCRRDDNQRFHRARRQWPAHRVVCRFTHLCCWARPIAARGACSASMWRAANTPSSAI